MPRLLVVQVGLEVEFVPLRVQHLLEPGLPLPQLLGVQLRAAARLLLLLLLLLLLSAACGRFGRPQLVGDAVGDDLHN